jgi:hypothetical protein
MSHVGTLMTENAVYPVFAWLAFALVLALERPTLRRQLILLALCALAFLTRAQAVALVASALTAPLILAWIERGRPRRLGAWKPLYGIVGAGAVLVVAVQIARGQSPSAILGGYSVTTSNGTYHLWPSLRWIVFHLAGLDLSLFVLPFAALIVLVATARHLDRAVRVFSAAAVALVVWLTLEVAVFASAWSFRIEERNLFHLAPLFLIALLAWIERGQPRPPRAAVAAAGVAAALPGTIPFLELMNITAQSDTPFIQPWWYLGDTLAGRGNVALLAVAVAAGLAALFLWLPGRYAPVLPVLVAAGFFATWLPLQLWTSSFARVSVAAFTNGIQVRHGDWIDRTVGTDANVVAIWSGDNPYRIWENEFWNRSVRRLYGLGSQLPGGMPETELSVQHATGFLVDPDAHPLRARYVLADRDVQIEGTPLAADAGRNLVLYRVRGPVRTAARVTGWYADTWTAPHVVWQRHTCARGVLRLHLRSDPNLFPGVTQRIAVSGTTPSRVILLPTTKSRTVSLPLRPEGGACTVALDVTPSRTPVADPRRLGVHIDYFTYLPTQ